MGDRERIWLSPPYLAGRETQFVSDAIASNWIAPLGPDVNAFEVEIAKQAGMAHAAALSSGTAAIHLCLRVLGVQPGDTVFCSDLTFAGSCNPIVYQGAQPVFIDSEAESWNMSPVALEAAFAASKREGRLPAAVILVDLYGRAADYDSLLPICARYGVPVVEDAAEALGSRYKGRPCGSFGVAGCFSFNGNKIITTSGGGMAVSNDEAFVKKIRFLATQAREPAPYYEHKEIGFNYRMSNISAALGRGQIEGLAAGIARRRGIQDAYRMAFADLPVAMRDQAEGNHWLSVVVLDASCGAGPLEICTALAEENIEARPVWKPMHLQPVFRDAPFFTANGPSHGGPSVSQEAFERGICLPTGSGLTDAQQARVIEAFRRALTL